jgi:hypothetical protein
MRGTTYSARCTEAPALSPPDGRIKWVNPLADPDWDTKVAHCPGVSFFHGTDWARVLHDTYGYRPTYFIQESDGRVRSLLPFMEVDSWLTGRRGLSLPFTDECDPIGPDASSVRALMREASALAAIRQWRHWEVRGGTAMLNAPAAVAFYGHKVELDADPATLLARCDDSVRRAIRKAESNHLTIAFAKSIEATHAFHELLCKTRRRHGLPPQPWRFFENIQHHVLRRHHGCIVLASIGDQPVSGAVFFHFGHLAMFKFGASDETYQHLRPNNLVMWRAIEWHARAGFSTLDLGRTSLNNDGLRRFKLGWGARERRIEYARFDCRASAFVTTKDRSSGWHDKFFRMIPESLSRAIGSAAYRHIA